MSDEMLSNERSMRRLGALEALPDFVFYLDRKGAFTDFHAARPEGLALSPDDFLGRRVEEVLPPPVSRHVRHHLALALATDQLQVFEYALTVGGERRFFEARMVPISDGEVVSLIRDISRRRRVEHDEAVRKRISHIFLTRSDEKMYADVLDVLLEAFESRLGHFGYINDDGALVCSSMTGAVGAERQTKQEVVVFPPESWGKSLWGRALRERRSFVRNTLHRTPEGDLPILRSMGAPIVHCDEVIGLLHVANRQVDYEPNCLALLESIAATIAPVLAAQRQRARAIRDLRQSEARFRDITLSMGDWVWEVDCDGLFTYCTHQIENVLGYAPQDVIGKSPFDRMEGVDSERNRELYQAYMREPRPLRDQEVWVRSKHDRLVNISLNGVPRFDEQGQFVGYRGVARDITDRRRMHEEALRAQKLESLGVLAGGIAHDFNNILTTVFTNASLAKAGLPDESEARARLVEVERSLGRARGLTQQLLTFAKGGAPVTKPSSVGELVRESVRFALTGSNVGCETRLGDGIWPIEADPGQIGQVMQNLVLNALQAMPAGGTIRVAIDNVTLEEGNALSLAPGRYVSISVGDEGIGIPERHLERIFDPYFSTKHGGSGLGLSVTYSVVQNHRGHIGVDSILGEGTTFRIHLPAAEEASEPADDPHTPSAPADGSGRLLVMDDDEGVRDAVVAILERGGYAVDASADGEGAVRDYERALAAGQPYDAVLLDLTVPGAMGGREAFDVLQTLDPHVRAIVTSGYSNDPVMAEFRLHGFRAVLVKPFLPEELISTVRGVLAMVEPAETEGTFEGPGAPASS